MVAETTVPQRLPRAFERAEPRPGWLARFWEWLMSVLEPVPAEDWTEPELELAQPVAAEAGQASAELPVPSLAQDRNAQGDTGTPRVVHPAFGQPTAYCTHVLDRMLHLIVDLRAIPHLTPIDAADALRPLNAELSTYARQQYDRQRRMERNQTAAVAQAVLLEEAAARGAGEEAAAQAAAGITGRATHVGDLEQTGTIPVITDDTPDPRTLAQPREVNAGDAEPTTSPVHTDDDQAPAVPLPTDPFLGVEQPSALGDVRDSDEQDTEAVR